MRKEKRQSKKLNRFNYHNKKKDKKVKNPHGKLKNYVQRPKSESESDEEIPSDEEIMSDFEETPVNVSDNSNKIESFASKEKKEEQKYFNSLKGKRIEQLKQQNEDEDKIINKYEKLLRLNKKKSKNNMKFNDGLDYLLEICTDDNIQNMYQAAKETDELCKNDSKDRNKKLKEIESKYLGDDEDYFNNLNEDDFAESDNDDDEEGIMEDEEQEEFDSDEQEEDDLDDSENDEDDENEEEFDENSNDEENEPLPKKKKKNDVWEDIYGRTRDKEGNVLKQEDTKYVPPHLRQAINTEKNENLITLRRQLKGFINRLAETNLHRISIDLENVFNQNPRNDVNSCLMEIVFDSLVTSVLSKERQVLEHILLISVLHANIGSEIGAYFLEQLVTKIKNEFSKNAEIEDKTIDNLILILCHLYTFKVINHTIIYELLDKLCEKTSEKFIECIVLVLKSIGIFLRKDDPLRLKEFILKIQNLANSGTSNEEYKSRQSFMLDILLAVKNNNITKIPNFDSDTIEHFRKLQKQFIRDGNYVSSLNVTMEEILNAENAGRWWLVGSAWSGKDLTKKNNEQKNSNEEQKKIFELARKHKMNTDEKRSVFYILMTSEDCVDAFEKIVSSTRNEKVIVAVIIHCCISEKNFNPYYNFITQKLSEHNRKYALAFQYALWDKVKELKNLTSKHINNLAKFTCFLIESGILPISILKIIEFDKMENIYVKFLRNVMIGILMCDEEKFHTIFQRISGVKKLNSFKDQLRLFLKVFLLKSEITKNKLSEIQSQKLNERLSMADKYLIAKMLS